MGMNDLAKCNTHICIVTLASEISSSPDYETRMLLIYDNFFYLVVVVLLK